MSYVHPESSARSCGEFLLNVRKWPQRIRAKREAPQAFGDAVGDDVGLTVKEGLGVELLVGMLGLLAPVDPAVVVGVGVGVGLAHELGEEVGEGVGEFDLKPTGEEVSEVDGASDRISPAANIVGVGVGVVDRLWHTNGVALGVK